MTDSKPGLPRLSYGKSDERRDPIPRVNREDAIERLRTVLVERYGAWHGKYGKDAWADADEVPAEAVKNLVYVDSELDLAVIVDAVLNSKPRS